MKNRRFPYGYEMRSGQIAVCPAEAETVKRIFSEYLAGENLKNIAASLTKRQVEYLPGEYGWNKSRIKRMIEDVRYTGVEPYPAILDEDTFRQANEEKDSRRSYTAPTVTAENKQLAGMVFCGECGGRLYHRTDNTQKHRETWYCQSESCKHGIPMGIAELEKEITAILNRLIAHPALVEPAGPEPAVAPSLEIGRMENEIERQLEALDFDKAGLQAQILQCAARKYSEHTGMRHITGRLKADLEQSGPLSAFSMEFFGRTVSAVTIASDKTVTLKLKNDRVIGKEPKTNGSANHAQDGEGYPAEAGILR